MYLYHGVPDNMIGTELIPLSTMSNVDYQLYREYAQKYKGREDIMQRVVPLLECFWNDVVQFLPLHPQKIFDLQKELGLISTIPRYSYFEIDIDTLDQDSAVVFYKSAIGDKNIKVKWLRDVDVKTLEIIPPATVAYYKTLLGTGDQPFNYQFVPHVLNRGAVDIKGATVVTIS